ncbi:MAG: hypothetical protein IMF04_00490 [Proteobacteria bacterium]|nr:hypothetical protein [Pseudomonadota bacterium]
MTLKATINASNISPELTKMNDNEFVLQIDSDDIQLSLTLDAVQIQILGLKCVHYIPDIEPKFAIASEEEVYRIPAKALVTLEDRDIQTLMRQIQCDELRECIWYMQDTVGFADKIINNMSKRAAEMMRDDLASYYGNQHPDTAELRRTEKARQATLNILNITNRLQSTGEISGF